MQSEKLKALPHDWRQRARDQFGAEASAGYEPQLVADTLNGCADELDAELTALASPSPAPSEPLREALARIEKWGNQLQNLKNPDANPVAGQHLLGAVVLMRAALDSTKASERDDVMQVNAELIKQCGNVLDNWEQLFNDVRSDPGFERLDKAIEELYKAVLGRDAPTKASEPAAPARDGVRERVEALLDDYRDILKTLKIRIEEHRQRGSDLATIEAFRHHIDCTEIAVIRLDNVLAPARAAKEQADGQV